MNTVIHVTHHHVVPILNVVTIMDPPRALVNHRTLVPLQTADQNVR